MWLDNLDPDWEAAKFHGEASKIGRVSLNKTGSAMGEIMCLCCHQVIEKQPIPICENTKQLEHLGLGVPLYYTFLRSCITLIFLSICCYHMVALYWAISHNSQGICNEQISKRVLAEKGEPSCWTFMVKFSRLQKQVSVQEQLARIANWLIQFFFLLYTRNKILKRGYYYDQISTTLSDYSILIKNLRPQPSIQKKIKKLFKKFFSSPYKIQQITLLPPDLRMKELQKEKKHIRDNLRKYYKKEHFDDGFQALLNQYSQINEAIYNHAAEQFKKSEIDELQVEKVIVVFNTEAEKAKILQEFPKLKKEKRKLLFEIFGEDSSKVNMDEAPEPDEIFWNHINEKQEKGRVRSFISWTISIAILAVMTVAIYFILHAKTNLIIRSSKSGTDQDLANLQMNGAIALVYITILFILFFNKLVMSHIFHKLTDLELLETGFKFQRSFGIKYCLGLFFTTAVMTLIVEGLESNNFATYLYGLIDEETLMFFAATTFVPLFWLVNPLYLWRLLQRKLKFGRRDLTQKQANHLMQNPSYDVGKRYAEIVQIVWFTYLYSTLIPFGAFLSFIGLNLFYWVDKYNLLRRSVLNVNIGFKLHQTFMTMLQITLIMAPAGALLFDGLLREITALDLIPSIIMMAISLVYLFLPKERLIDKFNYEEFMQESKLYSDIEDQFIHNYHSMHPLLKIINQKRYIKKYKNKSLKKIQKNEKLASERHLLDSL